MTRMAFTLLMVGSLALWTGCDGETVVDPSLTSARTEDAASYAGTNRDDHNDDEEVEVVASIPAGDIAGLDADGNPILCTAETCALVPGTLFPPTDGSSSELERSRHGLDIELETTGLPPGAYTSWWIIFDNPAGCVGAGPGICGPADFFSDVAENTVYYAAGFVVGPDGEAEIEASTRIGDDLGVPGEQWLFGDGLTNPMGADVFFDLVYHGPASSDPAVLELQTTTIGGGCLDGANAVDFGEFGIGCFDPQIAIHRAANGSADDGDDDEGEDDDDTPMFSDWSAPVNLGPVVNTAANEVTPFISKDGRSLFFVSDRPGGSGVFDLWVSQRATTADAWGPARNLGPTINTQYFEITPTLSLDEHRLYFTSDRPGGFGSFDFYVSRRRDKRDDFGWGPVENVGSDVNTPSGIGVPAFFEDEDDGETTKLYFHSNRPGGLGGLDIYVSTMSDDDDDETFGPAVLVEELSGPFNDRGPDIRRDGLEMFITSNRPGTLGSRDLWVSTRASTSDVWSAPQNLGPTINTSAADARAVLSFDGTELYFSSTRPGGFGAFDLYMSTREKLKGPD